MGNGAIAGGGFLQGFNSVIIPHLQQQAAFAMQKEFQDNAETRKELDTVAQNLDAVGQWKPKEDPDQKEAHDWLYTSDWKTPPPPGVARTIAKGHALLNSAFQQSLQPQGASPAPAAAPNLTTPPPTAAPAQATAPSVASAEDLVASQKSAVAAGMPANLISPADAQVPTPAAPAQQAQAQPAPQQQPTSAVDRAAAQFRAFREAGGSISRGKGGGFTYSLPGVTFDERQKKAQAKALDQSLQGVPVDQATQGLDPASQKAVRDQFAAHYFTVLVNQGTERSAAAKEAIAASGSMAHPLVEYAYGVDQAAQVRAAQANVDIKAAPAIEAGRTGARITTEQSLKPSPQDQALMDSGWQPGTPPTPEQLAEARGRLSERQVTQKEAEAKATALGTAAGGVEAPRTPEDRAAAVVQGKGLQPGTPEYQQAVQQQLKIEKQKEVGPAPQERKLIAEQSATLDQLGELEKIIPQMTVLGPAAGRLANLSEAAAGSKGLSNTDVKGMAMITAFRNDVLKQIAGARVPQATFDRIEKQLPDVKQIARVNMIRIQQTRTNLQRAQKYLGETLQQSGVTQLPTAVQPSATGARQPTTIFSIRPAP